MGLHGIVILITNFVHYKELNIKKKNHDNLHIANSNEEKNQYHNVTYVHII